MLGWTLQHDAVGRRFGEGFDRAAAISAYRKARELEPRNTDITADLAVLLEHDANGVRYSPEANIDLAIAEYRARRKLLSEEDSKSDEYANNLYYALLYAGRYGELREALREAPPSMTQRALVITTVAAERGGPAAIEMSRSLVSSEADRPHRAGQRRQHPHATASIRRGRRSHRGQYAWSNYHRGQHAAHRHAAQDPEARRPQHRAG
jgi:hypothetical protein